MFGDYPNNANYCDNGIISSERRVTPKLLEVKKVYQYLRFKDATPDDANKFTLELTSKYFHKTVSGYTVAAVFTGGQDDKAGRTVLTGKVPNLAPGETAKIEFKVPSGMKKDMFILVFPSKKDSLVQYKLVEEADPVALLKSNQVEEARKYAVAYETFTVGVDPTPLMIDAANAPGLTISGMDKDIIVRGGDFTVEFADGRLSSVSYGGRDVIRNGPNLISVRAPVDSDKRFKSYNDNVMKGVSRCECRSFNVSRPNLLDSGSLVVDVELYCRRGDYSFVVKTKWSIYADGTIRSENAITSDFDNIEIPCLGFTFELPAEYRRVDYLGRGPQENYIDRRTGTYYDTFHTTVQDMFVKYSRTQHFGNRTGVSWVSLASDTDKLGVTFRCENNTNGMEFAATEWTQETIADAKTPDRLPPSDKTILELDIFQAPLGSNSCGPIPLEKYTIRAGREMTFRFDYTISKR